MFEAPKCTANLCSFFKSFMGIHSASGRLYIIFSSFMYSRIKMLEE